MKSRVEFDRGEPFHCQAGSLAMKRLTAHGSRLTAHGSRLTAHGSTNNKQQTTNNKQQTTNNKQQKVFSIIYR
jgi:hypothetical protein